jgi:hypothetical protein
MPLSVPKLSFGSEAGGARSTASAGSTGDSTPPTATGPAPSHPQRLLPPSSRHTPRAASRLGREAAGQASSRAGREMESRRQAEEERRAQPPRGLPALQLPRALSGMEGRGGVATLAAAAAQRSQHASDVGDEADGGCSGSDSEDEEVSPGGRSHGALQLPNGFLFSGDLDEDVERLEAMEEVRVRVQCIMGLLPRTACCRT